MASEVADEDRIGWPLVLLSDSAAHREQQCPKAIPHEFVFDFRIHHSSLCAHGNARFRLQTPSQRPGGPKAISHQLFVHGARGHSPECGRAFAAWAPATTGAG